MRVEGETHTCKSPENMDRNENSPIGTALKDAERCAAKSGEDPIVSEVLECAKKEITGSSRKSLWQDAAEFNINNSVDRVSKGIYDQARRRMMNALSVQQEYEGHVVGHALVRAVEAGCFYVVRKLRQGQAELTCSVLAPRFLAFALMKAAEIGHYEILLDLISSTTAAEIALVGYELAWAKDYGYPHVQVNLTKDWKQEISYFKTLLPPAKLAVQYEKLELWATSSDQENIHDATRACYQIYLTWRLLVVSGCNGHGGVFRELLVTRDEFNGRSGKVLKSLQGHEHSKVAELGKIRIRIDDEFLKFAMKMTAKLGRDILLYELFRTADGPSTKEPKGKGNSAWRCTSKAQFGLWEVLMEAPVLLMEIEGSYQDDKEKKQLMRHYHYVKPLIPQIMKLNIQFKIVIDIQPNYIELIVGINHVRVIVDNQCWEEKVTGHFPTRVALSVTPVAKTLTSVTLTGSSSNNSYKVGVGEQVRVGVSASIKAAPTAGISFQAGKSTVSKIEGKPWRMEQLPVYNERGGSFTWILANLHGASFDRFSPMLQDTKKSIWQFGKRIPVNPLMVLPFGTNGGINFTGTEFDDTLSWRFANDLENTMVQFNIEGQVHTTHITQDTFWETRVVPFEVKLEQKLEPCGDPLGADKKKKKKKKK